MNKRILDTAAQMPAPDSRHAPGMSAIRSISRLWPVWWVKVPTDRAINGVDQLGFFLGKQDKSNRDGFVVLCRQRDLRR
jgi:hypothetical protein